MTLENEQITNKELLQKIDERFEQLENKIHQEMHIIKTRLSIEDKDINEIKEMAIKETIVFEKGIHGLIHKDQETQKETKERLEAKQEADEEINHPQERILKFLLNAFDTKTKEFQAHSWTTINKECNIGSTPLTGYLEALERKGYIEKVKRSEKSKNYLYKLNANLTL